MDGICFSTLNIVAFMHDVKIGYWSKTKNIWGNKLNFDQSVSENKVFSEDEKYVFTLTHMKVAWTF